MSEEIEKLLFKQIERPKNLYAVKSVNLFENRYRINVWVEVTEDGLAKKKIASSYFARLNDDGLVLVN